MQRVKPLKMGKTLKKKQNTQRKYINILVSFNSIIIIISLCVTGFGVFLKLGGNVLLLQVEGITSWIITQARSAGLDDFYLSNSDLVEVLQGLSIPLIAFGAFSTVLSSFGTHIARKKIAVLLIPYAGIITIGLLTQAASVVVLFAYRTLLDEHLKSYLLANLHENYRGYNETNVLSQTWNIVMVTWHCCGVNDYADFEKASHWRRKLFQDGWWFELQTPLICCNMEKKDPGDFACAVNPSDITSYYMQGCYSAFWKYFDANRGVLLAANICLLIVQLILMIASILLVRHIRQRSKTGADVARQNEECTSEEINTNGREHTLNNGLLNHLSFLGLSGQRNSDIFQRYQSGGKRYSIHPDILTQLLSGSRRFSQMPSCDYGVPQGRMHSFDFGIPHQNGMPSFDFGGSSSQMPPFNFGVPQGPIIVQLPQQPPTQNSALKAITEAESSNVLSAESEPMTKAETPRITEIKKDVPKFERCKSENCINLRSKDRKSQKLSESTKPELNRRKTLPNGMKSQNEAHSIQ